MTPFGFRMASHPMLRRFFLLYFPPLDWLASLGSWLRSLQMREMERVAEVSAFEHRIRQVPENRPVAAA
jgi:hypothetical protein